MRKKKKKLKKGFISFIVILLIAFFSYEIIKEYIGFDIKNIYVHDNKLLQDEYIIKQANLEDYPNFYTTTISSTKKNLEKSNYIESVTIKKKFFQEVHIYVNEYDVLFLNNEDKMYVLENGKKIEKGTNNLDVPTLINYVPNDKYEMFIDKYNDVNIDVRNKISEIKYDPNEFDEDRFLLYMNDENYVYVTLTKLYLLDKYNNAIEQFEGKKGILYLDSGNYFKIIG